MDYHKSLFLKRIILVLLLVFYNSILFAQSNLEGKYDVYSFYSSDGGQLNVENNKWEEFEGERHQITELLLFEITKENGLYKIENNTKITRGQGLTNVHSIFSGKLNGNTGLFYGKTIINTAQTTLNFEPTGDLEILSDNEIQIKWTNKKFPKFYSIVKYRKQNK